MKTSFKEKMNTFLFGAEGINKGDCFTYSYETILWGLILWFATFDKLGLPIFIFFILWGVLMVWMWTSYLKAKKKEENETENENVEKEKV